MRALVFSVYLLAVPGVLAIPAHAFDHSHKDLTDTLAKYQDADGLMKYAGLKKDSAAAFARYVQAIQGVTNGEFNGWSANQQKAYLINAYNALTVKLILDNYPVKSIKKIGGLFTKPWSVKFFKLLGGQLEALDPIEHEFLRPKYKNHRIHAAVNCASYSCPPLRHTAFTADKLDAQLDEQMTVWLADAGRNQLGANPLKISKIFDWYKKDFEQWGGGVLAVVGKYGKPAGRDIEYLDYNWDLNESKEK